MGSRWRGILHTTWERILLDTVDCRPRRVQYKTRWTAFSERMLQKHLNVPPLLLEYFRDTTRLDPLKLRAAQDEVSFGTVA